MHLPGKKKSTRSADTKGERRILEDIPTTICPVCLERNPSYLYVAKNGAVIGCSFCVQRVPTF